ncbi:flavin reductase family protein [Aquincola sp. S2]|uniref:Flavin reductase family protein n=1 Tax=Pseudaquabacterium terrae TaxID=2732868 RepID=A0ABX2EBD6_9BURK|nr:flavin reductase family protein [Aquabacterium terrae]NRF65881.1 flavin reductase family protein [Aquabacterium terrae]
MNTAAASIDKRAFRNALGAFTTGVTVVTTCDAAGRDVGLTVNSFNSVSLEPPLVLWSLARSSGSLPAFVEAEHFAVHILAADQEPMSNRFAQRGADKFAGIELARGEGGVPLLPGCAARFRCRTAFRHEGGDHEIFVGEVLGFEAFERAPLVFHKGGYAVAVKKRQPPPTAAAPLPNESPEASISRDALVYLLGSAHAMLLAAMRPALAARGLSDDDYFVLNILSVGLPRTVEQLDALMGLAGRRVTLQQLAAMAQRALVRPAAALAGGWQLAEAGTRAMLEMAAISKATEEDALQQIDYSEAHLLKHLLRRVIRNTWRGEQPALWPVAG